MNIGQTATKAITKGASDDEALAEVLRIHPHASTKIASIRWYRNRLNKGGPVPVKSTAIPTAIAEKFQEVRELAESLYDIDLSKLTLSCDLRGHAAGQARWNRRTGESLVRLNLEAYSLDPKDTLGDTIPHEIAHIVCGMNGTDRAHGHPWRDACRRLGGHGGRTHSLDLTPTRTSRRFLYRSPCGREIELKSGRHNKLQRGKVKCYTFSVSGRFYRADFVGEVMSKK